MKKYLNELMLCLALSLVILPITTANAGVLGYSTNTTLNNSKVDSISEEINNINNDDVVEVFSHGNDNLYLTQSDIELMAKLVYAESRGEPFDGQVAVASVVLNRVLSDDFPNSISDVIFQPNAFSCVKNGNITAYPDQNCFNAVYTALKGSDPTNEALFFYNPTISTCSWMLSTAKYDITLIGHHVFFKL